MVLYTTQALMEADDDRSAVLAARALEEMNTMLALNNDIFVGNGVADVNHVSAIVVCTPHRLLFQGRTLARRTYAHTHTHTLKLMFLCDARSHDPAP